MALPKVGVEAVIEGMAAFEADSKKVNKAFDDMDTGASKLGKGATGLTTHLTSLGSSILKMGAVAGGAALAGVVALSAGLASFAIGGIKQAIDLDQQVANIAATMGATTETAGTLKDELKGLALDLSLNPNLTVDVTQAGQAIEVLAANGALATDEFGKLTEASKDLAIQTVALANATGSDFTTAATIATDAMALFGLETDEMGKAVDGAAGIMNASKFSAQDYQLALSNAGGIAAEMGISIEDFNTVLAGTASNFASGSDAGTSFKTLMQRLANPTDEVKAAMQQYGISLFDANGEMRSMSDIAQDLNQVFNGTVTVTSQVGGATKEQSKAAEQASAKIGDLTRNVALQEEKYQLALDVYNEHLKYYDASEPRMRKEALALEGMANKITDNKEKLAGYQGALDTVSGAQARTITSTQELTEAQKAQLAATLGGADGARILLGLADLTGQEFTALSEQVNLAGQGMEAAALRVDTVKGAMDIFKGVLQAIQIQVGDAFLPLLKELAVSMTQLATQNGPMIVGFFEQVASSIDLTIAKGMELFAAFQSGGAKGLAGALGISPETFDTVVNISTKIGEILTTLASYGGFGLAGILAVDPAARESTLAFLSDLWNWLSTNIPTAIQTVSDLWNNNLMPGFNQIAEAVNSQLLPALQQLSDAFLSGAGGTQSFSDLWQNTLLPALMTTGAFVRDVLFPAWVQLEVFLVGALSVAITTLASYWQNILFPAISMVSTFITGTAIPALTNLWDWLGPKLSTAIQTLADFWTGTLQPAIVTVFEYSNRNLIPLLESIGNLFNAVINKALQASAGLWQNVLFPALKKVGDFLNATLFPVFQSTGKTLKEDVSPILRDLGEEVLPIVEKGMDLVNEAVERTISFFNSLASTINDLSLPPWLQMHSPPPLATALNLIAGGANAANSAITGMMNSLASTKWSEIRGQVFDLVDDMQDEGHYAAMGYGKSTGFAIKQAFVRAFNESFEGIMAGTISAEQLEAATKREAGAYAERVSGNFDAIVRRARESGLSLLMQMQQDLMDALPGMASTLTGLASNFADIVTKQIEGFHRSKEEAVKFAESVVSLNAKLGEQQVKLQFEQRELGLTEQKLADQKEAQDLLNLSLTEAIAEYGTESEEATKLREKINDLQLQIDNTTLSIDEKTTAMSKLSGEMDKNRETIEKNERALAAHRAELRRQAFTGLSDLPSTAEDSLAAIEVLQEFLDSEESMLALTKEFGGGASTTWYWDRVAAQEELNRLLEEQRAREEQITRQKEAQQKLSFLQSQIDLIKMGRELGGNIFGGITFGLGASADDLLSATNRVVEAMIGQINTTLGIASPSQIMVEVGQQIMAGLQRGIVSMTPTLNAQLSASVMGPLSPMMAAAMSAGNTSTTVNNWNVGGNSINNGIDVATFEARVLQVIRRNL